MKIYTSYFKNITFLKEANVIPVGVCRFPPKDFNGPNLYGLAPSAELLMKYKEDGDKTYYTGTYFKELRNSDIVEWYDAIKKISEENNGKDIALCCYEEPDEFCHRHLLAEWLNQFGIFGGDIHEFTAKDGYAKSVVLF